MTSSWLMKKETDKCNVQSYFMGCLYILSVVPKKDDYLYLAIYNDIKITNLSHCTNSMISFQMTAEWEHNQGLVCRI